MVLFSLCLLTYILLAKDVPLSTTVSLSTEQSTEATKYGLNITHSISADQNSTLDFWKRGRILNGVIASVVIFVTAPIVYALMECVCCVCYGRGVLWQKYGHVFHKTTLHFHEVSDSIDTTLNYDDNGND